MKKSKFLMFAAIVCSSVFFASCSSDIESNGNGTQGDDVSLDVQVVDENPDTRMYMGTDNYNYFTTGDKLGVWSKTSATKVEMTCTENGKMVSKLNGKIGQSNGFYAGYPYDAVVATSTNYTTGTDESCAVVKFTDAQTYTESEVRADGTKFVPILVGGTSANDTHIKLYNACAIFKVTFINDGTTPIKSVRVDTNGPACITNVVNHWGMHYNGLNIDGIAFNSTRGTEAYGTPLRYRIKPLTIAVGSSETIYFILPLQSATYDDNYYSFSACTNADGTAPIVTKKLKDVLHVERNKIYNFGNISASHTATSTVKIISSDLTHGTVKFANAGTGVTFDNNSLIASSKNAAGTVDLVATPYSNSVFDGWYNGNTLVSTNTTLNVNITANNGKTYNAIFRKSSYIIKIVCTDNDHAAVQFATDTPSANAGYVTYDNTLLQAVSTNPEGYVYMVASPKQYSGYVFDGWYDGSGNLFSTDRNLKVRIMDYDGMTYYARFKAQ